MHYLRGVVLQGSLRIEVGDAVKLAPATGDTQDTVGQLHVNLRWPVLGSI